MSWGAGRRRAARKRSSGRTRFESRARSRSERARAHLERARGRNRASRHERDRRPLLAAGAFTLSLLLGAVLAAPVLEWSGRRGGDAGAIESISVRGNVRLAATEVAEATGVARGSLASEIDEAEIDRRLAGHPWIESARALRLPSGALAVRIVERQPAAALAVSEPASTWLVDPGGTPFAEAAGDEASDLPRLASRRRWEADRTHPTLAQAVLLARDLGRDELSHRLPRERVQLWLPDGDDPEGWVLRSDDGALEVVLGREAVAERLERLAELLTHQLPDLDDARRIDLRFTDRAILGTTGGGARGGRPASG